MQAIILAGGLGTRLRRAVPDLPKPLAPVAGRPFLDHVLAWLSGQGVTHVVLAVSYQWEQIRDEFGTRSHGMKIRYSIEEQPLGTGGAIAQAFQWLEDDHALVINGDTWFPVDLAAMYTAHRSVAARLTMAVKHVPDCSRYGRVLFNRFGVVEGFAEKQAGVPGWINGGCYCVARWLLEDYGVEPAFSLEQDILAAHVDSIHPLVHTSDAHFIDIGVPEDWQRAEKELRVTI